MKDISPELLEKLRASFEKNLSSDARAAGLLEKVEAGKANYEDAGNYAEQVGNALAKAFESGLSSDVLPDGKMYWNIAQSVISPLFGEDYDLISSVAVQVQQALNTSAGIGLKAVSAPMDQDMLTGVLNKICSSDDYDSVAYVLQEASNVFSRAVADNTLKENIDFQGKCGRSPKIVRTASAKCCTWCADLEGTYTYPNVPHEVYTRHDNCRCTVEYDPGTGSEKRQDVWSKQWTDPDEAVKIQARKNFTGLNTAVDKEKLKTIGIKNNPHGSLPMDLQFFAEKGLSNQSSPSLKKGIKSLQEEIILHEGKMSNPEKYDSSWNEYSFMKQQGAIKHWKKEIKNFNESIDNRIKELKRRGDYDE